MFFIGYSRGAYAVRALAGMVDYADALSAHHGGQSAHDIMRKREIEVMGPLMEWVRGKMICACWAHQILHIVHQPSPLSMIVRAKNWPRL